MREDRRLEGHDGPSRSQRRGNLDPDVQISFQAGSPLSRPRAAAEGRRRSDLGNVPFRESIDDLDRQFAVCASGRHSQAARRRSMIRGN